MSPMGCCELGRGGGGKMGSIRNRVTPDPELALLISRWRGRAQELLTQVEKMLDADARLTMQEIAAKYEVLAHRVEQQVGKADK